MRTHIGSPNGKLKTSDTAKESACFDRKTLEYVTTVAPPGITGVGHLSDTDSKGNLCISGANGRIQMQKPVYKGLSAPARQ